MNISLLYKWKTLIETGKLLSEKREMNVAIIIAGGSGARMGQDIPKQFINVYDKPVLIYTLEGFQKHPQIDAIEVVCIDGWHAMFEYITALSSF